jgi:hypothetical protein
VFETNELLTQFLLFVLLPLWGIAGFADWICHRLSRIEATSGIFESFIHALMGVQVGITILLCLFFEITVLILLICFFVWLLHEVIAHIDVKYAAPRRDITIWEMHAHNYLSTLPMYMLITIVVLNWGVFMQLISLDWVGQMSFKLLEQPHGGDQFVSLYLLLMTIFCVFPYMEEFIRCLRFEWLKKRKV